MEETVADTIDDNQWNACLLDNAELPLSLELKKKAEEELQEKEEWQKRDIAALRDLVTEDSELKSRLDDAFLLRFLRARKFDYDCSFEMLQQYYRIRAQNRRLFAGLCPSAYEHVFSHNMQMMLPQRDRNGCRIFIFRPGAWDPSTCSMDDIFCTNVLLMEHVVREQETQICGVVAIQDFTGFCFRQMRHFTTEQIRRVVAIVQGSFPLRFKGFHFVFEPKFFFWAFAVVRPFLNKKIIDRMHFHGSDLKSLHAHFSRDILPRELGGAAPSYSSAMVLQQLLDSEQYFVEHNKYGYGGSASGVGAGSARTHFYPGTFCMQTGSDD